VAVIVDDLSFNADVLINKWQLLQSALMPCRFTFRTDDNREYVAIFKHGDDLRQDQLVLQIITLMDRVSIVGFAYVHIYQFCKNYLAL